MRLTKDILKSLNPCINRWKNYLKYYSDWSGGPSEFLDLENISHEDKLWVILRPEFIPEKKLHLLACDFAEPVLVIFEKEFPHDERPRKAIEAKRLFVNGKITEKELEAARAASEAARVVAWAASEAAWAARAAASAASEVASAAARAAASAAARAAEQKKQIEMIKKVLCE